MDSLNNHEPRGVHDWIKACKRFWERQIRRIKGRAERMERRSKDRKRPRST